MSRALLALACAAGAVGFWSPWAYALAVAALASLVALDGLRLRGDLKVVKESAAAVLKLEARLSAIERALRASE